MFLDVIQTRLQAQAAGRSYQHVGRHAGSLSAEFVVIINSLPESVIVAMCVITLWSSLYQCDLLQHDILSFKLGFSVI